MQNQLRLAALLMAAFASFPANAEPDIWVCAEAQATGFRWTGGAWEKATFAPDQHVVKVNGLESSYTIDGHTFPYECKILVSGMIRCNDQSSGGTVVINPITGSGALSELRGAASTGQKRDSVSVSILRCNRL